MSSYDGYEDIKGWRAEDFGKPSRNLAAAYDYLIHVASGGSSRGDAIDIGFGNGEMLAVLRNRGFDAVGVEVNPALIARAHAAGFPAFENLDSYLKQNGSQRTTLVTCFHVLEHIKRHDLNSFFAEVARSLPASGCFIAAFPNGESPFSALAQNGDLTHETQLTRETCRALGLANGLTLQCYAAFPPPALFSTKFSEQLLARVRFACEKIVGAALRFIFYGRTPVEMSPVAYCVWRKD